MKTVSMKPVVQKPRKDGFWAVYIRFTFVPSQLVSSPLTRTRRIGFGTFA